MSRISDETHLEIGCTVCQQPDMRRCVNARSCLVLVAAAKMGGLNGSIARYSRDESPRRRQLGRCADGSSPLRRCVRPRPRARRPADPVLRRLDRLLDDVGSTRASRRSRNTVPATLVHGRLSMPPRCCCASCSSSTSTTGAIARPKRAWRTASCCARSAGSSSGRWPTRPPCCAWRIRSGPRCCTPSTTVWCTSPI